MKFQIVDYCSKHKENFFSINAQWIEAYFSLEAEDVRILSNPEQAILNKGGAIYIAEDCINGEALGVVALLNRGKRSFELSKMGVRPEAQGLGIGRALVRYALDGYRNLDGNELFLETNAQLAPAIKLYESFGFEQQRGPRPGSKYSRANVYMLWRGLPRA